jgi:hypothetical protein
MTLIAATTTFVGCRRDNRSASDEAPATYSMPTEAPTTPSSTTPETPPGAEHDPRPTMVPQPGTTPDVAPTRNPTAAENLGLTTEGAASSGAAGPGRAVETGAGAVPANVPADPMASDGGVRGVRDAGGSRDANTSGLNDAGGMRDAGTSGLNDAGGLRDAGAGRTFQPGTGETFEPGTGDNVEPGTGDNVAPGPGTIPP